MAAATPTIKVGDTIPEGTFGYVPYTPELEDGVSSFLSPRVDLWLKVACLAGLRHS